MFFEIFRGLSEPFVIFALSLHMPALSNLQFSLNNEDSFSFSPNCS